MCRHMEVYTEQNSGYTSKVVFQEIFCMFVMGSSPQHLIYIWTDNSAEVKECHHQADRTYRDTICIQSNHIHFFHYKKWTFEHLIYLMTTQPAEDHGKWLKATTTQDLELSLVSCQLQFPKVKKELCNLIQYVNNSIFSVIS